MRAQPNRRGQSGLTMIELLITLALAAIVLGPIIGVAMLVMNRYRPTVESAEASKQLRLFRTVLADDWASAAEIVIDPMSPYAKCSGPNFNDGDVRLALVTSYSVPGNANQRPVRILYRTKPQADGTIQVIRQVCRHVWSGNLGTPSESWGYGGRTDAADVGRSDVLLPQVRALVLPTGHGCTADVAPPFPPCDMNVTVVGIDGDRQTPYNPSSPYSSTAQRTTVRLHQQVGPQS